MGRGHRPRLQFSRANVRSRWRTRKEEGDDVPSRDELHHGHDLGRLLSLVDREVGASARTSVARGRRIGPAAECGSAVWQGSLSNRSIHSRLFAFITCPVREQGVRSRIALGPAHFHLNRFMPNSSTSASDRVGPFVAGSTSSEVIALAQHPDTGLRLVDKEEQAQDHFRQRCDGLSAKAKEFFYDYEESTSLVFQRMADSKLIPDFVEYAYCWLAADRLGGLILLGVTSEAGTHEQINQQENAFREQSDEVVEALSCKYPQSLVSLVNYFKFERYMVPPPVSGIVPEIVFTGFERLVNVMDETGNKNRIDTEYFGPAVVLSSRKNLGADVAGGAAHTSQSSRKILGNDAFFVVYDHEIVRYVRTIESLHSITSLVYLSRRIMDDVGRKLNSARGARIQAEARREVDGWENALRAAADAKRTRISKLSEVL